MDKYGVIHGRFQGLHKGHLEYLLAGMSRCEHLYIGITNFDSQAIKSIDKVNPKRTNLSENPFSYYERYRMVKEAMLEAGVRQEDFDIVPFPIEEPERISNYVPMNGVFYITVYDQWGIKKKALLDNLGVKTVVMWTRTNEERLTSGTEVRMLIRENNSKWKELVPNSVVNYIMKNGLEQKIREWPL